MQVQQDWYRITSQVKEGGMLKVMYYKQLPGLSDPATHQCSMLLMPCTHPDTMTVCRCRALKARRLTGKALPLSPAQAGALLGLWLL